MPAPTTTTRMTAEEFCDWVQEPENRDKWFELEDGEVIELPGPTKPHCRVCANITFALETYVRQRHKGYVLCNDSGVILKRDPDLVRGPDVALYEDAVTFAELHPKYGEQPPRLAVEVLSPNDRAKVVTRKITDYLDNGVDLVWLVDPELRRVTVYRRDRGPLVVGADGALTGEEILPELRCRVVDFFLMPGEPALSAPAPKPASPRRRTRRSD